MATERYTISNVTQIMFYREEGKRMLFITSVDSLWYNHAGMLNKYQNHSSVRVKKLW